MSDTMHIVSDKETPISSRRLLLHHADRHQLRTLFTFDRRDFSVYRTPANKRLKLIPNL